MFTMTGEIAGESGQITYSNGKITGTNEAVDFAKRIFRSLDGEWIGIVGAESFKNHIENEFAAYEIILGLFDSPPTITGEPPTDDVPFDAVI